MSKDGERLAQKARTREAILNGARLLLMGGEPVTVTAAAARAGISKATAYRYFADPDLLAVEAGLSVEVLPYEKVVEGHAGTRDKLRAIGLYFIDLPLEHEAAFRRFLARSLDASTRTNEKQDISRGARRVAMFETALKSSPDPIDEYTARRLVAALTAATGVEPMIALLDVVSLDRAQVRETVLETTEALLDRLLPPDVR